MPPSLPLASTRRRLAALLYESLPLFALWFFAGFLVVGALPEAPRGWHRLLFQGYLLLVTAIYFVWFWRHGGQTLAMKAWRIRLVDTLGRGIGARQAWLRFALAALGAACLGAGFLWCLLDREGQFLHDRLAGTRLVTLTPFDVPEARQGDDAKQGDGQKGADDRRPIVQ